MSSTTLITFLGTGNYDETCYTLQGSEHKSKFTGVALAHFLQPARILLCVTNDARNRHEKAFREGLGADMENRTEPVLLPDGKVETEMWQLFSQMEDSLHENEQAVFDITHGFRTIPMMAILAASYLRLVKQVEFTNLYYGAFEAEVEDKTPFWDLSPFLTLLDFTTDVHSFLETSSSLALASRLRLVQGKAHKSNTPQPPTKIQPYADMLKKLSENYLLAQPREVMKAASELKQKEEEAFAATAAWSQPLFAVLGRVSSEYEPFAHSEPDVLSKANLQAQLNLIKNYLDHGHYIHAADLMREWLVSWVVLHQGLQDAWLDREIRTEIENSLNEKDSIPAALKQAAEAFKSIAQHRNTLSHCGMGNTDLPKDIGRFFNEQLPVLKKLLASID